MLAMLAMLLLGMRAWLLMERLWYAAFGSNLSRARFMTYLEGGRPPRGTETHRESGARDGSEPHADQPWAIDQELHFAHRSRRWGGGGTAFVDPTLTDSFAGPTLCRLYDISVGQFEDVHRQECGMADPTPLNLDVLDVLGRTHVHPARYGLALLVGEHPNGRPIVTITAPARSSDPQPPSAAYLLTIADGLAEAFAMTPQQICEYLASKEGVRGYWSLEELMDVVQTGQPARQ